MSAPKLNTLEIFNAIWSNLGEIKVTDLSGVSADPDMQKCFDDINTGSLEIANIYPWKVLKTTGASITLLEGINYYAVPEGMYDFDPNSFRYDTTNEVVYLERQDWNEKISDPTLTGSPIYISYDGTYFYVFCVPSSTEVGKTITYDCYILPDLLSVSTPTATSWLPAPYDRLVLVKWVSYLRLRGRMDAESVAIHSEIYGGNIGRRKIPGSLLQMKKSYADVFKQSLQTVNARQPRENIMGNSDYGRRNI